MYTLAGTKKGKIIALHLSSPTPTTRTPRHPGRVTTSSKQETGSGYEPHFFLTVEGWIYDAPLVGRREGEFNFPSAFIPSRRHFVIVL